MILVGDIGGTKTRLAVYERDNGQMVRQDIETFASSEFPRLEDVICLFLNKRNIAIQTACFGVPGPVANGMTQATNLPWRLNEKKIAELTRINKVKLVNDLVATTTAVPHLGLDDLVVLHKGEGGLKNEAPRAVIAPGTGCGQAYLTHDAGQFHVHASEGGHADFAPNSEIEIELLKYLQSKVGRVSYERVLCGPGLVNIYEFLKNKGYALEPAELRDKLQKEDAAAVISRFGQSGEYDICVKALDIFVSVLGAQAGNLVLTLLATGGIFLGGGIPPKIIKKLSDGTFVKAFLNKGRLSNLNKKTSLYIIKDDHVALLGAAYFASTL